MNASKQVSQTRPPKTAGDAFPRLFFEKPFFALQRHAGCRSAGEEKAASICANKDFNDIKRQCDRVENGVIGVMTQ